jgi:DNA-binding transcriptional LysR family regulator
LSAASILTGSDLALVLPLNVARDMVRSRPLVFRELSHSPKPIEAAMIWPRRLDNQPAHAWLRDVIIGVNNDLRAT